MLFVSFPTPVQFGARDLGFYFLGSTWSGLTRSWRTNRERPEDTDSLDTAGDGRFGDEAVDPEVVAR